MDMILIILATLGLATIFVACYILSLATNAHLLAEPPAPSNTNFAPPLYRERNPLDRRRSRTVSFPLIINNVIIEADRRKIPDRRQKAA